MLSRTVPNKSPVHFLARGAVGGALGGLLLLMISALQYKLTLGYVPYAHLFIIQGLPVALVAGAFIGGLVGGVIWILSAIMRRNFGVVLRSLIGFLLFFGVFLLFVLLRAEGGSSGALKQQALSGMMGSLFLGALPGAAAQRRNVS